MNIVEKWQVPPPGDGGTCQTSLRQFTAGAGKGSPLLQHELDKPLSKPAWDDIPLLEWYVRDILPLELCEQGIPPPELWAEGKPPTGPDTGPESA